jgi:NTP pyrophosphatase (non-canonical NTP hydrolase)
MIEHCEHCGHLFDDEFRTTICPHPVAIHSGTATEVMIREAEAAQRHLYAFDDYQTFTNSTAKYPGQGSFLGLVYCALGLAGEAGELANKVKKILRDTSGELTEEVKAALADEAGDVNWYLAQFAAELKMMYREIPQRNVKKLEGRMARGTISGSGDNR